VEAVHQALVLQAILEAPHQTDHARDKIPGRMALLDAWLEQAAIPGFDVINTYVTLKLPSTTRHTKAILHPTAEQHTTSTTTGFRWAALAWMIFLIDLPHKPTTYHPDLWPVCLLAHLPWRQQPG
jgi:hypothetical protein